MLSRKKDPTRCSESVHNPGTTVTFHQCTRKPVKDGFCNLHHPESVEKRQKKINKRWEERRKKDPLYLANQKIRELEKEILELKQQLLSK